MLEEPWREADGELLDADARPLRGDEVAELVDQHQQPEDWNRRQQEYQLMVMHFTPSLGHGTRRLTAGLALSLHSVINVRERLYSIYVATPSDRCGDCAAQHFFLRPGEAASTVS